MFWIVLFVAATIALGIGIDLALPSAPIASGPTPRIVMAYPALPYNLLSDFALNGVASEALPVALERATHECMKEAGFYYPEVRKQRTQFGTIAQLWVYRTHHGYGDAEARAEERSDAQLVRAELRYVESLSQAERSRFWRTLTGSPRQQVTFDIPVSIPTGNNGGCEDWARTHVLGAMPLFQSFYGGRLQALLGSQFDSSIIRPALMAWSGCMSQNHLLGEYFDEENNWWRTLSTKVTLAELRSQNSVEIVDAVNDTRCFLSHLYSPLWLLDVRLLRNMALHNRRLAPRIDLFLRRRPKY